MNKRFPIFSQARFGIGITLLLSGVSLAEVKGWWNPDWAQRQAITVDASELSGSAGETTALVRLHDGNFQFSSAREDGSDIRFTSEDGKTVFSHQIESFDNLLNEAFVWVRLPGIKSSGKNTLYIYFGNQNAEMPAAPSGSGTYDDTFSAVYHFSERGTPPVDSTSNGNNSETPATTSEGSLIGNGLRLLANTPITLPATESLAWTTGAPITLSMWVKAAAPQDNAIVFSRTEGKNSLRLLLDQCMPVIEVTGDSTIRSEPTEAIPAGTWAHITLVSRDGKIECHIDGKPYSTTPGTLPALNSPLNIGSDPETTNSTPFVGEIDELRISNIPRPDPWIQFAAINQGATEAAQRTLFLGEIEGDAGGGESSHIMEHLSLFGDIASNMMFDGWIAIGVCAIMIVVGWTVAIRKFFYLNSIEKGSEEFLKQWKLMSTDLTALNHADKESIRSLGGKITPEQQQLIGNSPLYHIYHIGSDEISNRLDRIDNRVEGLPGRSIQAIRAALDAGLVHETHRLSNGLVYLTISIAGGPYVGLLGTVVGVMITFAIIARSGEVNVQSIAPGIASALLATVVGLVVAIPALFIYSYLNGRIRNSLSIMQVFIDEFVAKMAEFYRPPMEPEPDSTEANTNANAI